jgi:integrase
MSRERHQNGWVEEVGKKVKKWKGHYYVYDAAGKRRHHSADLGKKSGTPKWKAEEQLRHIIERQTGTVQPAAGSDTLEWFWTHRFVPMQSWDANTAATLNSCFKHHVFPALGATPLAKLDRFQIQVTIQENAHLFSKSVVHKIRTYLRACLEEAVDQDLLLKNPMRKLPQPDTRPECRRYLSIEEIQGLLDAMESRDRLIVRICIVCGLRPGELFAAKWDDFDSALRRLRIDESAAEGRLKDTKTPGSRAHVWMPPPIVQDLLHWKTVSCSSGFIFPSKVGGPIATKNFLKRNIWPAAIKAGIMEARPKNLARGARWVQKETSVNFQAFRRTCATWFQKHGTAKDIQAHLRHSTAATTLGVYVQEIPDSVREAVEALDRRLFQKGTEQAVRLQ